MKEGWGGGEKGFKLIFTTRKELVIRTIWGETSFEAPRLPPAPRVWSLGPPGRCVCPPPAPPPFHPPIFSKHQTPCEPKLLSSPPRLPHVLFFTTNKTNCNSSYNTSSLLLFPPPDSDTCSPLPPISTCGFFLTLLRLRQKPEGGEEERGCLLNANHSN